MKERCMDSYSTTFNFYPAMLGCAQDKKYYIDEVEDIEEVYEVIKAYVNNKKEWMKENPTLHKLYISETEK